MPSGSVSVLWYKISVYANIHHFKNKLHQLKKISVSRWNISVAGDQELSTGKALPWECLCTLTYSYIQFLNFSLPYLCFFCFVLSFKPLCKSSLSPWSYRAQKRLASGGKKSVHLSVRHPYHTTAVKHQLSWVGDISINLRGGNWNKYVFYSAVCQWWQL